MSDYNKYKVNFMTKIVFKFKNETIKKAEEMFPNEQELHTLLETNNPGALDCILNISHRLTDLMYEINTSTVDYDAK